MTRLEPDSDPNQSGSDNLRTSANPTRSFGSPPPQQNATPVEGRRSVAFCPICEGGLCSVRAFFQHNAADLSERPTHGLVICDECEAIWLQPDVNGVHVYPDAESPLCPISGLPLYGWQTSRWATAEDVRTLGWSASIDHSLDDDPSANDPLADRPNANDS